MMWSESSAAYATPPSILQIVPSGFRAINPPNGHWSTSTQGQSTGAGDGLWKTRVQHTIKPDSSRAQAEPLSSDIESPWSGPGG